MSRQRLGLNDQDVVELAAAYAQGMSMERLSDRYGVSPSVVRRLVVEQGGQIRPTGRRPVRFSDSQLEVIRAMRGAGKPWREIEPKVGVSRETLANASRVGRI